MDLGLCMRLSCLDGLGTFKHTLRDSQFIQGMQAISVFAQVDVSAI